MTGTPTTHRPGAGSFPLRRVLAVGVRRGLLEMRQMLRTPREAFSLLSTPLLFVVLSMLLDGDIPGSDVPMAELLVAGGVTTMVVQAGLLSLTQTLAVEREDGTLLRMRAVPHGIPVYLVAKTVVVAVTAVGGGALTLAAGVLVVGSSAPADARHWLILLSVPAVGLLALVPFGAVLGAVLPNAREALGFLMIPMLALMVFSGIYFPVSALPGAVQDAVQAFPLKWTAQGVRAALLPDSALSAETSATWELSKVYAINGAWALMGFLVAPRVLRRMTRRATGTRPQRTEAPA
ncbi:ABC transporter permease [Streptomyces cellulosae]|uniref:Transport permease protein n=2 Tax=Streptomyces TaxID=1883 RepID=A0ABU3J2I0_9ACTN|nr:ABC-2 type transport system permease protein [Streptomyces thermodiastaticus]MDT6969271.1 ABC transporter permease [Streptomyces thermocarboxydus]THC55926.1 ABC transporter permease [Streptomyces sp. Akac8]WSB43259.1 ABC transporter permease [Streptomyces cellulosae]UVT11509.1 ABC transporter permease [Streptomyces thermocarboxydus]